MQFILHQHGEDINVDHHIRVLIRKDQWRKWYDEMMRRFKERDGRTFDVDECQELGVIGIEHLQECLNFLSK